MIRALKCTKESANGVYNRMIYVHMKKCSARNIVRNALYFMSSSMYKYICGGLTLEIGFHQSHSDGLPANAFDSTNGI